MTTDTDRALLEAAARAAGIALDLTMRPDGKPMMCSERGLLIPDSPYWWNPLHDDGDGARLEAALGLHVEWWPMVQQVRVGTDLIADVQPWGTDRQAARRLAAVRAAAAMAPEKEQA